MRLAFLGTPTAAVPALDALVAAGHDVRLVVTRPDRPVGRRGRRQPPPVKVAAVSHGLPVVQPESARGHAFREAIASVAPEFLVVVAYGKILPKAVLASPVNAPLNVHFSLLPAYRGAAPVQWALAKGEQRTGVSIMRIEEGLDTGAVYAAREISIAQGEHAPSLEARLAVVGADLLLETLERLAGGPMEPTPQNETLATEAPLLRREDGWFRPDWPALEVEGRVRGFDPWPGVWARRETGRLRLVDGRADPERRTDRRPGEVIEFSGGEFHLACAGGTVFRVAVLQPEGRRVLTALEARNGRQLAEGDFLATPDLAG